MVLGKFPPPAGKFPPQKFPPIKLPHEKLAPGKLQPRKFSPEIFPTISLIVFPHLTLRFHKCLQT